MKEALKVESILATSCRANSRARAADGLQCRPGARAAPDPVRQQFRRRLLDYMASTRFNPEAALTPVQFSSIMKVPEGIERGRQGRKRIASAWPFDSHPFTLPSSSRSLALSPWRAKPSTVCLLAMGTRPTLSVFNTTGKFF